VDVAASTRILGLQWQRAKNSAIEPVVLHLPDAIAQRFARLAEVTGRTKTFYMIEAIKEHLDDLEDLYLAEQRLIDIRAGKSQTVPLEEAMRRYGSED